MLARLFVGTPIFEAKGRGETGFGWTGALLMGRCRVTFGVLWFFRACRLVKIVWSVVTLAWLMAGVCAVVKNSQEEDLDDDAHCTTLKARGLLTVVLREMIMS